MPWLSVIIPCKDEAHNIHACIESVKQIADEIIVADSGSTDGTLQMVRERGDCKVIEREYINSANFKNWAIPQAKHDWVLIVDADERVTPELAAEISNTLSDSPAQDGYRIRFATYFLGNRLYYSGTQTSTSLRLFRKSVSRYSDRKVHADVIVDTKKIGSLESRMDHFTCQCLNRYAQTFNRYTTWSALDMQKDGRKVTGWGVVFRPIIRFSQFYIVRRGFLDGASGFMFSAMMAYYTFLKYSKLWELEFSKTKYAWKKLDNRDNSTSDLSDYHNRAA